MKQQDIKHRTVGIYILECLYYMCTIYALIPGIGESNWTTEKIASPYWQAEYIWYCTHQSLGTLALDPSDL